MSWNAFVVGAIIVGLAVVAAMLVASARDLRRQRDAAEAKNAVLRRRLAAADQAVEKARARAAAIFEASKPRALTDVQHDRLARALKAARAAVIHVRIHDDRETKEFAAALLRALDQGGTKGSWERIHSDPAEGARFGDFVQLRGTNNGRLVLAALRAAAIPVRETSGTELLPPPGPAPSSAARPDVVVTLNERLPIEARVADLLDDWPATVRADF